MLPDVRVDIFSSSSLVAAVPPEATGAPAVAAVDGTVTDIATAACCGGADAIGNRSHGRSHRLRAGLYIGGCQTDAVA